MLVPGTGSYSRGISSTSEAARLFFDQGLRLSWGFYFPEAIASHMEAARLDPSHPMPWWGMAQAMGPNPNSRYARMPDDPKGEGLKAIRRALELRANASPVEQDMIDALYVLYDQDSEPDPAERDQAYLRAARALYAKYPNDADVAALFAAAYMCIGRWDYWDTNGNPKSATAEVAAALDHSFTDDARTPGNQPSLHSPDRSIA